MSQDETQTMDDYEVLPDDETVEIELGDEDETEVKPDVKQSEDAAKKGDIRVALKQAREREKRERERADKLQDLMLSRMSGETKQEPVIDPALAALKAGDYDPNLVSLLEKLNSKLSSISDADSTKKLEVQLLESKYPGISEHADEVVAFAKQKGLSTEDAYLAKYGKELLSRSRDEVLREAELRSAAKQTSTVRVSSEGNSAQQTPKKNPTLQLKKSELDMLEQAGISPKDYARYLTAKEKTNGQKNPSMTQDELRALFGGKPGTKKG